MRKKTPSEIIDRIESLKRQLKNFDRELERSALKFAKLMRDKDKVVEAIVLLEEAHAEVIDLIAQRESMPSYFKHEER